MSITIREAEAIVKDAIEAGLILRASAPNSDPVTAGPNKKAIPDPRESHAGFRDGSSRWSESFFATAPDIARWFVFQVGRGAARRAVARARAGDARRIPN